MRMLFLTLLLANVVAFGYIRYAESRPGSDAQIGLLQISPERLKLMKPEPPKPVVPADKTTAIPAASRALVCLEWGAFASEDRARAEAVLAGFGIAEKVLLRESGDSGWWVYIPSLKTRAEADRKAVELKTIGVAEFYIVQDTSPMRLAISLGAFRTEEGAASHLAQLREKGVRSAVAGPRGARTSLFVIRDPADAVVARLAELKVDFPDAVLKPVPCIDTVATKS